VLGPFDLARATAVTGEELYSGRLIRDRAGRWVMLAFRNLDADGGFIGEITDPMPVRVTQDGAVLRELPRGLQRRLHGQATHHLKEH
jgi:beta-fructofuranosidase